MMTSMRLCSSPYNTIQQNKVLGKKIELNSINCGAARFVKGFQQQIIVIIMGEMFEMVCRLSCQIEENISNLGVIFFSYL